MELWVLDSKLQAIHLMDTFESLIWTDRYYACGDFEVHSSVTDVLRKVLVAENYLWSKNSEHTMIVEDIQIESDVEDGGRLTVTGRSLESILDRRIVFNKTVLSGNLQDGIERLLNENIISPTDESRKIENFIFEASDDEYVKSLTVDQTLYGENLYTVIQTLCETNKIGFKVTLNELDQFVFKLYNGVDRSYDQFETPYVIFSPQFDNIINSNYLESIKPLKTFALVAGSENEDGSRPTVTVEQSRGGGRKGLARREMFIDGGGVSKTDANGKDLTEAAYKSQLTQKGREELAVNVATQTFEGEVESTRLFKYGEDFFMGDIVQVTNEYGVEAKTRIVEFVTSQDVNGIDTYPTFETIDSGYGSEEEPEYMLVEYIESTGTQYIDTGFIPNQDTRVVCDVEWTPASSGSSYLFGAENASVSTSFSFAGNNGRYRIVYNNAETYFEMSYSGILNIDMNKNVLEVNGTQLASGTYATFAPSYTMYICCVNRKGSPYGLHSSKIYSCKIYDNDVLVRDYIPVRDEKGVACLYDKVEKKFYYNAGTGEFTAPTKSHTVVEYIKSTGTQYIDTLFKPKHNSRVVMDLSDAGESSFIFGARGTDSSTATSQFGFYILTASKVRSDYFGTNVSGTPNNIASRMIVDKNGNVTTAYGLTLTNTAVTSGTVAYNLTLFAVNSLGEAKAWAKIKLYSCQIYDDGVLIRDFIPVIDHNGVACLYDKLNHRYYRNAGTGEFLTS